GGTVTAAAHRSEDGLEVSDRVGVDGGVGAERLAEGQDSCVATALSSPKALETSIRRVPAIRPRIDVLDGVDDEIEVDERLVGRTAVVGRHRGTRRGEQMLERGACDRRGPEGPRGAASANHR